jgi:hypothetical protein
MPLRACKDCDRPTSRPDRRCPDCATQHSRARGNRHTRGYGSEHERLRAQWTPAVEAGAVDCHATTCVMPSRRIKPGTPWHLGHTADRTAWTGPEHATCNTVDGGRRSHPVTT